MIASISIATSLACVFRYKQAVSTRSLHLLLLNNLKTNKLHLHTKTHLRKMTDNVFVYGTLKRGEPNHHWLTNPENGNGEYVGEAETIEKYPLIIASRYNIPFLLYEPGKGFNVKGEIYKVDTKMLLKLDILEDHPNYYVREIYPLQLLGENGKRLEQIECWVYFLKTFKKEILEQPMMQNYSSSGDHGRPYCESEESNINDVL